MGWVLAIKTTTMEISMASEEGDAESICFLADPCPPPLLSAPLSSVAQTRDTVKLAIVDPPSAPPEGLKVKYTQPE